MKNLTKLAALLFLLMAVNDSYGQPLRCKTGHDDSFYSSPVVLDGQLLDYTDFTLKNHGVLFVDTGNPQSDSTAKIPFYIYLKRNGKIVESAKMKFLHQQVYSIDLSEVLFFGRAGDQLIVVPVLKPGCETKAVVKIGDGC